MTVELNHTVIWATDRRRSAEFLAAILGLSVSPQVGPFLPVRLANQVTLDYAQRSDVAPQHYAFLVGEDDFDAAFERIKAAGLDYWADPFHSQPNAINSMNGGRGVYFDDPDGHSMELMTKA